MSRCCSIIRFPHPRSPRSRKPSRTPRGSRTKRGDTISIGQIAFAKTTSSTPAAASPLGYAKYAVLGIAAVVFLFLTTRSLRRREREPIEEPVWLRELDAPMRLAELEREASTRPIEVSAGNGQPVSVGQGMNGAGGGDEIRRQVEQLADNDPDRVAAQLRTWMQED